MEKEEKDKDDLFESFEEMKEEKKEHFINVFWNWALSIGQWRTAYTFKTRMYTIIYKENLVSHKRKYIVLETVQGGYSPKPFVDKDWLAGKTDKPKEGLKPSPPRSWR